MKSKKIDKLLGMVLFMLGIFVSLACALPPKPPTRTYFEADAYVEKDGKRLYFGALEMPYYLEELNGSYYALAVASLAKASFASVSVYRSYTSGSAFKMILVNNGADGFPAINNLSYIVSSGKIIESTISINVFYMDQCNNTEKTHVILHEIGHTFGLDDIQDSAFIKKSVMYYMVGIEGVAFDDYPEWDKTNILWKY